MECQCKFAGNQHSQMEYETDDHIHGQKRNLHRSMNEMSPNMPRNIHPNRFYLEKKITVKAVGHLLFE
jgi:hypothetical protein